MTTRLLFLYTELADYTLACLRQLSMAPGVELHVVHWPVSVDAPFAFDFPSEVSFYERGGYSTSALRSLARDIDPRALVCSGWIDRGYLAVCRALGPSIPRVMAIDTEWTGSLRQRVASLLGPALLKAHFSHLWIPGKPQEEYVERLGFRPSNVLRNFYSTDVELFRDMYLMHREQKEESYPKRFLFVGRYHPVKGIRDLWDAFEAMQGPEAEQWELYCLGTGPLRGAAIRHPRITHFGFVQPRDLSDFVRRSGVYVMPSHDEPWGVSLHAFAAAGLPLICSDRVGASSAFLEEGLNGYTHPAGDSRALREAMSRIIQLEPKRLVAMGRHSAEKAQQITPTLWAKTLLELAASP